MVCLGLEPGAAVWKVQTNPLSNGGTHLQIIQSLKTTLLCIIGFYVHQLIEFLVNNFTTTATYPKNFETNLGTFQPSNAAAYIATN